MALRKKDTGRKTDKKEISKDNPFKKFFKNKGEEKSEEEKEKKPGRKRIPKESETPGPFIGRKRIEERREFKPLSDRGRWDDKPQKSNPFEKKERSSMPEGKKMAGRGFKPLLPFGKAVDEGRDNKYDRYNKSSHDARAEKKPYPRQDGPKGEDERSFNTPDKKNKLFSDDYFLNASKRSDFSEREERQPREVRSYSEKPRPKAREVKNENSIIRLNKFVAQSGICSRRKAAELVKAGEIWVNGVKELNPAYETKAQDVITYKSQVLKKEEKMVYLLMNKPKNIITTSEDEKGRRTVLDLVKGDYDVRLYPVGRLDRNTTGLILLTNDGDLAKKLSHPSHQIKKVYIVELDKNLKSSDLEKIREGLSLEDGIAEVDGVDYIEGGKKNEIGIEIHSGKNRIVRRIFEALGYEVTKLDRTFFAGLTKKDLPRGFSRELNEQEIIMLKHFTNHRKNT